MTVAAPSRLAALAGDPALAPLARLEEIALAAFARDAAWRATAAGLVLSPSEAPLLAGATLRVDAATARSLLTEIAIAAGVGGLEELDPLAVLEAAIAQREEEMEALASIALLEPAALMAIGQVFAWPVLLRVGERARGMARPWERGYCPTCAAWPLLAELRGIDRTRVLRCGRCATEWPTRHLLCPFCGNDDHRTLGHLASEGQRESRRVTTCERCHAYLKSFATLRPLDAEDLAFTDLTSVDLDVIALDRGYGRPAAPAQELRLTVEEAE